MSKGSNMPAEEAQMYNLATYEIVKAKIAGSGLSAHDSDAAYAMLEKWKISMVGEPVGNAESSARALAGIYNQKNNLHNVSGFAPVEFRGDSIGEIARVAFVIYARIEQAARGGITDFTPSNGFGNNGKPVGCDDILGSLAATVENLLSASAEGCRAANL